MVLLHGIRGHCTSFFTLFFLREVHVPNDQTSAHDFKITYIQRPPTIRQSDGVGGCSIILCKLISPHRACLKEQLNIVKNESKRLFLCFPKT